MSVKKNGNYSEENLSTGTAERTETDLNSPQPGGMSKEMANDANIMSH